MTRLSRLRNQAWEGRYVQLVTMPPIENDVVDLINVSHVLIFAFHEERTEKDERVSWP